MANVFVVESGCFNEGGGIAAVFGNSDAALGYVQAFIDAQKLEWDTAREQATVEGEPFFGDDNNIGIFLPHPTDKWYWADNYSYIMIHELPVLEQHVPLRNPRDYRLFGRYEPDKI